mgnify:CR=1 FL=1
MYGVHSAWHTAEIKKVPNMPIVPIVIPITAMTLTFNNQSLPKRLVLVIMTLIETGFSQFLQKQLDKSSTAAKFTVH